MARAVKTSKQVGTFYNDEVLQVRISWIDELMPFSDATAGQAFKLIFSYATNGAIPITGRLKRLPKKVHSILVTILAQIDKDIDTGDLSRCENNEGGQLCK